MLSTLHSYTSAWLYAAQLYFEYSCVEYTPLYAAWSIAAQRIARSYTLLYSAANCALRIQLRSYTPRPLYLVQLYSECYCTEYMPLYSAKLYPTQLSLQSFDRHCGLNLDRRGKFLTARADQMSAAANLIHAVHAEYSCAAYTPCSNTHSIILII